MKNKRSKLQIVVLLIIAIALLISVNIAHGAINITVPGAKKIQEINTPKLPLINVNKQVLNVKPITLQDQIDMLINRVEILEKRVAELEK